MESEQVDYLICGGCQKNFELASINNFVRHKKFDCDEQNTLQGRRSKILLCKSCPQKFGTPWSLLQHAQNVHALQIYLEQGDFSELSIQTLPAAAKEKQPAHFTTHQTLAFTPKQQLPDLSATPVMIIQGANGEKQLVRIEKPSTKVFPDATNPTHDPGTNAVALNTNTLFNQRVKGDPQVKSASIVASTTALSSPVNIAKLVNPLLKPPTSASSPSSVKLVNQSVKGAPVAQAKTAAKVVNVNPQSGQSLFAVLPQMNKAREKPAATTQASQNTTSSPRKPGAVVDRTPTQVEGACSPTKSQAPDSEAKDTAGEIANTNIKDDVHKAEIAESSAKESKEDEKARLCCDDQDCGVTVMPVTHKELEKCCSAVLPKKRKRHMAINHMPSTLRAKRKGEGDKYSVNVPTANRSFVIDIEHEDSPRTITENDELMAVDKDSQVSKVQDPPTMKEENEGSPRERSVIIQPGSSIAIPVSLESFRRLVGSKKGGRIPVRFPSSSPMPISMHVAPITESTAAPSVERDIKPVLNLEGQVQPVEENVEEKQETNRRGKRRYPTSRPFKCNQCEQGFNQRIHLQKHQSKHTGIKPFQCGQCSYSTVEKSHLKVHIRVHTGEKPFKCTYCEYATAQNSTLKIHLRRHHDQNAAAGRPIEEEEIITSSSTTMCSLCNQECGSAEALQKHRQDEHAVMEAGTSSGQRDVMVEQVPGEDVMELMQVDHPMTDSGDIGQMLGGGDSNSRDHNYEDGVKQWNTTNSSNQESGNQGS